jgi:DNA replication protein DnaC
MMPLPTPHLSKTENNSLRARAEALHLHGLLTHWSEVATQPWLAPMLDWEEQQRARRSLERRLSAAHIGRFKPLCDFDWTWPKHCDRAAVDALITLDFLKEAANVVFVGPNGVGKSMFAQNIAHQAVIDGHTVLFTSAGQLLGDLCALDSDSTLHRRLRHYARPQLLVIDEVGYLSYSNRHADMLFQLISRRYQNKSTLITTNRAFGEWNEVFPNAACVVSLVDRLVHNAEIVAMKGTQTVFAGHSLVWWLRGTVQRYSEADFDRPTRDADFVNDKAQEFLTLVEIQSVDGGPDLAGETFHSVSQPVLLSQLLALLA